MISLLINALIPFTFILLFILILRRPLRRNTDAIITYRTWLLLPLCLLFYFMPVPWQQISEPSSNQLQTLLVTPTIAIHSHLSNHLSTELALVFFWLTGFTLLCLYWVITHFRYINKLKLEEISLSSLSKISMNTKNQNLPISLAQSSHLHSPILIGLFTQILVIPEDFDDLYTDEQQQLIIAHEVCHFSHHHMWTNQLALLLLALFWFHPLAWRSYAAFRQDQEHSCDQFVLARKQTQSRIQYCKALVLAAETSPPNAFTLMSFKYNGEQNFMFNRIKQIKSMNTNTSIPKTAKIAIMVILSGSMLAGVSYAGNQVAKNDKGEYMQLEVHPTHRVEPKYPVNAAKAGTEGSVVLKFDVIADGSVTNVEVVNAKPAYVFDKTAVTALKQWRYKPNGRVNKNLLVQLDYVMSQSSPKLESLIERINVTN